MPGMETDVSGFINNLMYYCFSHHSGLNQMLLKGNKIALVEIRKERIVSIRRRIKKTGKQCLLTGKKEHLLSVVKFDSVKFA